MILTSPLEVFGGSEQARILHDPQAGCSHGDRGNDVLRFFPRRSLCSFLCIPGDTQGGAFGFPCRWVSSALFPPRRKGPIGRSLRSGWSTYSNPFRGRETKAGRSSEGALSIQQNVRGRFAHGRVDPRSHPFALRVFPKEYRRGSWVEPWRFGYRSRSHSRGTGFLPGFRASMGPGRLAILVFPFAEAMGNLCSFKTFLRRSFPKAFPSTAPGGSFGIGVRDESKGQILCAQ